ncbi:hypothetical protein FT643_21945 [Ketobacter sp. MCCC 1A13808]|uniref:TraK family protein n=1 Tax=Ketobacter sp. MCCC 1A13808 TaxID=2602738 RepID=UPI0012EB5F74|nr:TraK family protein [Ketobacter sp. MCCC 1A13808]MVF14804.1 hypothetical protein [Ketobacter sp. MCCC 1A13808]
MSERILEQLAEWSHQQPTPSPRYQQKIAFLAIQQDVEDAMTAGYSLKTIHAFFVSKKKLQCQYATFLGYVRRHIKNNDRSPGAKKRQAPMVARPRDKTFVFNPLPDKDQLI